MNNVMLIGRIASDLEIREQEDKKMLVMTLAVQREYKNMEGIYETDFIPAILLDKIAEHTFENCKKGDIIAVKGRIECTDVRIKIIANKVSFLSSKKGDK